MEEFLSQNVLVVVVALAVIITLIVVVFYQSNRIKDLTRPKYGFLGKPLSLFLAFGILAGGFGIVNFVNQQPTETTISNANFVLELNIIATQISQDQYRFNLVPIVDGVEWGVDGYPFTIYWSFTNDSRPAPDTEIEPNLTQEFRGGIIRKLEKGFTTIKATIFIDGNRFEKEIEIEI